MKPKSPREHVRSKIQGLHQSGMSISAICAQLRVSKNTVRKWIRKSDGDTVDKKRTGRPTKLTPKTKNKIKNLAKETVGIGYRTVTRKLNFSNDFTDRSKTVARSTVFPIFPMQNWTILMQDGAPSHTAKKTIAVIKSLIPAVWTDWPGNSPDLNPIEHLWARVQNSVFREPRPRDRQQLIDRAKEEWKSITQDDTTAMVESFPRRVREVLEKHGFSTSY
jgi:transposase